MTIQSTRKELEDWVNKLADDKSEIFTEKHRCIKELEGFNLGVSLAQKEFLDFLKRYSFEEQGVEICDCESCKMIKNKIKELKQSLDNDDYGHQISNSKRVLGVKE